MSKLNLANKTTSIKESVSNIDYFENRSVRNTKSLRKNSVITLIFRGLSMSCSYVMVPLVIDYVNTYQYGIWVSISTVIAWIIFFDIGLGNGLRNNYAKAIAHDDVILAKSYVSTAYFLLFAFSGLLMIIFLSSFAFVNWYEFFNVDISLSKELSITVLIAFGFQIIYFASNMIISLLNGAQKAGIANSFSPVSNVISLVIIYFFLDKSGHNNLIKIAAIYTGVPIVVLVLASIYYFSTEFKHIRPSLKFVNRRYIKDITGIGIKFFVLQICALILVSSTPFIIAHALGQEEVTQYNIMFKLYNIPYLIFYLLLAPYWSAFTDAYARNDMVWIKNKMMQLYKMWGLVVVALIFILVFNQYIFHLWIGNRVKTNNTTGIYMIIYLLLYSALLPLVNFINGVGKLNIQIYLCVICAIINIPLSFILAKPLGINGPVLANIICVIMLLTGLGIQAKQILQGSGHRIWYK